MNVRDWALISFTILAQMSVGSFLVLRIVHFFANRKAGPEEADRLSDRALLAIGPAMILGLLGSFLHLGDPISAYSAVVNFGSSWLSREILFGVLFAVVGGVFAIMQWKKISTFAVRNAIAWIAALIGLGLVFSMSRVYMLRTTPTWNTLATPVSFFTTTFLLGALAMGAAYVANYTYIQRKMPECEEVQCELLRGTLRWIVLGSIVLLGVEFLVIPLNAVYLATGPTVAANAIASMMTQYGVVFVLRLILVFLGAGIFGVIVYRNALSPGQEAVMGKMTYVAFALVLVAEVLSRFLFYASYARFGV